MIICDKISGDNFLWAVPLNNISAKSFFKNGDMRLTFMANTFWKIIKVVNKIGLLKLEKVKLKKKKPMDLFEFPKNENDLRFNFGADITYSLLFVPLGCVFIVS